MTRTDPHPVSADPAAWPTTRTGAEETPAGRFRARLRSALAQDLPGQVEAAQRDGNAPLSPGQRRELAQRILGEARRAHSEAELLANRMLPDPATEARVVTEVLDELFGMAGLQPLLDDPDIETININGCDRVFVKYTGGRRARLGPIADSDADLIDLVRTLAARASSEERRFDRGSPAVSVQLPGGARLFAVMALTAAGRPALSIRRHRFRTVTLGDLSGIGTLDVGLRTFLAALVRARRNVVITGGTDLGKTTLLRALASEIDPHERLVTIEDAFELGLDHDEAAHADVVSFQAREANVEGEGALSQADLVRWALRMTPDRVIVGEIRGPEVIPMCQAMSQGNDGSMATLHASTSAAAFPRLAAYAAPEGFTHEQTNLLVATAVHFVVHLAHARDTGARVVSSIREVVSAEGNQVISNEVYRPGRDNRAYPIPGALRTDTLDQLAAAGFDPALMDGPDDWWVR